MFDSKVLMGWTFLKYREILAFGCSNVVVICEGKLRPLRAPTGTKSKKSRLSKDSYKNPHKNPGHIAEIIISSS